MYGWVFLMTVIRKEDLLFSNDRFWLKIGNRLPVNEKIIITRDESRTLDDAGVTVVSLRDWLLSL
jgi:hypothetical protein